MFSFPVSQGQVSVDPPASLHMGSVIGVIQTKTLQRAKVRLDPVQPTGVGGRGNKRHPILPGIAHKIMLLVRGQVIEDEVDPLTFGITPPAPFPRLEDIG